MTFAEFVKSTREKLGLSKTEAANKAGTTLSYWSRIETGKRKPTNVTILTKIAYALNKTFEEVKSAALLENMAKPYVPHVKPKSPREALKELSIILDNSIQVPIIASMHAPGRPMDYIDIPKSLLPVSHKRLYAIRVKGDCMSPEVNDGDIVIVDKDDVPDIGKKILCYHNGEDHPCIIKIKRKSDADKHDLYGVVLWIMKRP